MKKDEKGDDGSWRCNCGTLNSEENRHCFDCGAKEQDEEIEDEIKIPTRIVPY